MTHKEWMDKHAWEYYNYVSGLEFVLRLSDEERAIFSQLINLSEGRV